MNHLSVEQCRKLKEVGFQQDIADAYYDEAGGFCHTLWYPDEIITTADHKEFSVGKTAIPTLEELIEWLGEQKRPKGSCAFAALIRVNENEYQSESEALFEHNLQENTVVGNGVTPLEAVYNLAVAVKSKLTAEGGKEGK